jgi:hypothetical protein
MPAAASPESGLAVHSFSVTLTSGAVRYCVDAGPSLPPTPFWVDVYIDMNNQPGAGLRQLLSGPDAFLRPEDAWEFALRFDRYQVSLYRSGRLEPSLIRTFRLGRRYEVEIPRSILRGNPLRWGYQVVITQQQADAVWKITDFLCPESSLRQALMEKTPVQLPALRASGAVPAMTAGN